MIRRGFKAIGLLFIFAISISSLYLFNLCQTYTINRSLLNNKYHLIYFDYQGFKAVWHLSNIQNINTLI